MPLFSQTSYDNQVKELQSGIARSDSLKMPIKEAENQNKLGYLYWQHDEKDKAIGCFIESIKLNEDIGNSNAIRTLCTNIGFIYMEMNKYDESIIYLGKTLRINQKIGKSTDLAASHYNLALAYQGLQKYAESTNSALSAIPYAQEALDLQTLKSCYSLIAENYENLGMKDKAFEYSDLANSLGSRLSKEQLELLELKTKNAEALIETKEKELKLATDTLRQVIQESKEKQLQIEILNKVNQLDQLALKEHETRAKNERLIRYGLIGFIGFVLIIAVLIMYQYSENKKISKILAAQNKEIERQRDIANEKSLQLTQSILYAKRIQSAVLPPGDILARLFPEHFIFYKPRDIVSGDFYWMTEKDGILIIAAADCTGHGVPGGFMSMLGIAFLNEIVNKIAVNRHIRSLKANEILNQLRENVISNLHQTGDLYESNDGLDISICIIDPINNHMQYAGANNPILIFRDGEAKKLKPDKMPIGIHLHHDIPFRNNEITLEGDETIYLYSDGYADQFGGSDGNKFMTKHFETLLKKIHNEPLTNQKALLEKNLKEWQGNYEQADDILIIGFKVPKEAITKVVEKYNWADKHILIAEDTDINYFLMTEALRATNVKLTRAMNGNEVLEKCDEAKFNIILMDVNMPVMDGIEATKKLREKGNQTPIVAQTAIEEKDYKEQCLDAGCNSFIAKPVDLNTFLAILHKHML